MNWVDFNILCVGERKPIIYKNDIYSVEVMNNNPNKAIKCYTENWSVVNRIQGIWYEFWTMNEKYDFIVNSTWKKICDLYGYQLFIDRKFQTFFTDIFNFYIDKSPVRKIIVLFRHQGYETGYIQNNMPANIFTEKLVNKGIYGNIAYILDG